jgi:hypothetical protein
LYSTILSYFALNNLQDELTAGAAGMVSFKAPSYGLFKTSLKPQYWFGIPRNVVIDGLVMDVDHIEHQVVERNNDQEQWKAWNRASGARMSAMEHLVPEMMFSTEENPAHGISAVKALQLAAAEGQKIWTITHANLTVALAAINLPSDIETDIHNSVYAGMEVTAHEAAVDFYGSSQVGYIVIDPETGAGGYLIGGGENGGKIIVKASDAINWISFAAGLKAALYAVSWGPQAGMVLAAINILTTLVSMGVNCPGLFDGAALSLIWFMCMAITTVGVLLSFLGPVRVVCSIAVAMLLQFVSMVVGKAVSDGC